MAILLGLAIFSFACGGDTAPTNNSSQFPTGISKDIEQQLKYDARVQDFEPSGNILYVNVNDSWMASPPGMRARALGQWYTLWGPSHGAGSKIVVRHEGTEIDVYTADKGYQPVTAEKKDASAT